MQSPFRPLIRAAIIVIVGLASGCTVNSDIMFKTPVDFEFDVMSDTTTKLFRIQPNDAIEFRLFANDGYKMIDLVSENANRDLMMINRMTFVYNVEYDGKVKLPLVGRTHLAGMEMREAEIYLEEIYSEFYVRPFVQVAITNRRVVVFNGQAGAAKTVPLENNNTTLLEVLANSGGLSRRGKAKNVKLFRLAPEGGRKVYSFDLSTIEGLKYADIVMEGDDIVYVQPNAELARGILNDLNPLITLLTTTLLVLGIVRGFQ